jgi:hypothetical protein
MLLRDLVLIIVIITLGVVAGYSQGLNSSDVVGLWASGGMSTTVDRNTLMGSTTPSNGSSVRYEFRPNGTFSHTGLLQSTLYGCTLTVFNDKDGNYEVSGSQITLNPTRNFWRKTNACAPNSNSERDYVLERETFDIRLARDSYGKEYVCLTNAKGERCFRREATGVRP